MSQDPSHPSPAAEAAEGSTAASPLNLEDDWDIGEASPDPQAEYRVLLRSLQRQQGFGLLFVQCSPADGTQIIQNVRQDLSQKTIEVLKFDGPIEDGNIFQRIKTFLQSKGSVDVLFIQGLEHSLYNYEETKRNEGWDSKSLYTYSWKGVPKILINLNQQRENFRDSFNTCFVFLIPLFVLKYIIRRAPDFFDWRSGVLQLPMDAERLQQESQQAYLERASIEEYETLSPEERREVIIKIKTLVDEPEQSLETRAKLYFELGLLYDTSNEYEKAIASYDKAVEIKPNYHEAWCNRGSSLDDLGRYEEAIASYDKAVEIKPDLHAAWYNRGNSLDNLGRDEEAIASYDKAVEIKPNYHEAWCNRGYSLAKLGRYQEAIASYDKAVEIKPDDHEAWTNRGNSLRKLGRNEEAIASYNKAVEIKPDDHKAWTNRGVSLHSLGRYEEAIASYDKALELQPNYTSAFYNKACCYALWGKGEAAIDFLSRAIALNAKYREMAKTDTDFDGIRQDERFQAVLQMGEVV